MSISNLCSRDLVTVPRGSSLQSVARLMKKHHIGGVVVVESYGKNKPVGIVTDRDIVLNVVAENRPLNSSIDDVMSKNIVLAKEDEGIANVVEQMEQEGIRRIIVINEAGEATGLVTTDDILRLLARELHAIGGLVQRQVENEKIFQFQGDQLSM